MTPSNSTVLSQEEMTVSNGVMMGHSTQAVVLGGKKDEVAMGMGHGCGAALHG